MGHIERDLYDEGRHYDLLMTGLSDLPFYQRQAAKYGGPVLELACGTGRLAIPLALSGVDITGLDVAPQMLEVARSKADRRGAAIPLMQADCRNFSLECQFQLIFIASNSLSHLPRREDVEACFQSVKRHLLPGGRFIVDLFTPSVHILARDPEQRHPVGQYEDPDGGGLITVTETNRYDPATQVNHIVWYYQQEGKPETMKVPLNLRMFDPQEIDALLVHAGFMIEHKYGDYYETPYGSDSPKQLIVCG